VLNHLGIKVNNTDEVQAFGERLEKAGLTPIWGKSVAEQQKVWAYDPDGEGKMVNICQVIRK
jgi:hypothetical protein